MCCSPRLRPHPLPDVLAADTAIHNVLIEGVQPFEDDVGLAAASASRDGARTALGRADFTKFYETNRVVPPMRMEDQFDAVMYLTTTITFGGLPAGSQPSPETIERCRDRAYMDMHFARMAIERLPQSEIDAVKRACGLP